MLHGFLQPTHVLLLFIIFGVGGLICGVCGLVPFLAYRSGYDRGYREALESSPDRGQRH